ncbi:replication factor A protein [Trifolium repens]|nr:replication factor A protein [Trifolium repens]
MLNAPRRDTWRAATPSPWRVHNTPWLTSIYKFEFNEDTVVVPSTNSFIPRYALSLIRDVVGVVTSVVHDKNVFVHGGITETVRFNLNDESTTFLCELYGDYVQEFRNLLKSSSDGLPILVLQFVELAMSRGNRLVKSIKNVTRMFFSPATVVDVVNFRKRVKLTFKVDDESGTGLVKAFDGAFLNFVELNLFSNGISADWLYGAFNGILGKSLIFVIKKTVHEPNFIDSAFELVRVVDHPSVFSYYTDDGYVLIPSKRITSTVCSAAKPKCVVNPPPCTTTTTEMIREYLNGSSDHLVDHSIVTRCVLNKGRT